MEQSPPILERYLTIGLLVLIPVLLILFRSRTGPLIRRFFTAETSPYNLAIFRIAVFAAILLSVSVRHSMLFSQMPRELLFAPRYGWRYIFDYMPIDPTTVAITGTAMLIFAVFAMVGLFTRFSAWMTVILGLYVIGIGQFYGKVSHWHHMLWFAALMGTCPSGAVLSIDGIRAAWKRADAGDVAPLPQSNAYDLPLRIAWILMGIVYFFPGLWKFWYSGFAWGFSDNMRLTMYGKWFDNQRMPFFRIDEFPFIVEMGGMLTIIWEVTFIIAIFHPVTRILWAIQGFGFHTMTRFFLFIPFTSLQLAYVSFVDWPRVLSFCAKPLTRKPYYILYDGGCGICRRTIATLNTLDLLGAVTFIPAQDRVARQAHGLMDFSDEELYKDMYLVSGGKRWKGFDAYRVMARRFPLLWPLLPFLYLPPVPQAGRAVYRRVADHRTCPIQGHNVRGGGMSIARVTKAFIAVSFVLVAGNVVTGVRMETQSWPFACYPTFAQLAVEPVVGSFRLAIVDEEGNETDIDIEPIKHAMWESKLNLLIHRITQQPTEELEQRKWRALLSFFRDQFGAAAEGQKIRLYRTYHSTLPDEWNDPPLKVELVDEITL